MHVLGRGADEKSEEKEVGKTVSRCHCGEDVGKIGIDSRVLRCFQRDVEGEEEVGNRVTLIEDIPWYDVDWTCSRLGLKLRVFVISLCTIPNPKSYAIQRLDIPAQRYASKTTHLH